MFEFVWMHQLLDGCEMREQVKCKAYSNCLYAWMAWQLELVLTNFYKVCYFKPCASWWCQIQGWTRRNGSRFYRAHSSSENLGMFKLMQTRSSFGNSLVDAGFVLEHRNSSEFIFACSSESGVARTHFLCKHIFVTHCSLCSTICNWWQGSGEPRRTKVAKLQETYSYGVVIVNM